MGAVRQANAPLMLGAAIIVAMLLLGIGFSALFGLDPHMGHLGARLAPPDLTAGHPFGTDQLGRDMLARTAAGVVWSITAAGCATLIALVIGTGLALVAAELGGRVLVVVQLLVNSVITLPGIVIAVIVTAVIGQGWLPIVVTLGIITWPVFARVILAEALSLRARDYVAAARLLGQSRLKTVVLHILPALKPTLYVMAAFHFADMLIAEGALSFLGLAAPLGEPTWGNMMADSRPYVFSAPWMLLAPAGAIIAAVIAANLIGDGLSRAFSDGD